MVFGDCVGNKDEKEVDCDFWTYWFRQELPRIGTRKAPQQHFIQLLLVLLHCVLGF